MSGIHTLIKVSLASRPHPAFQHLREKQEGLVCNSTWSSAFEIITGGFQLVFFFYLASVLNLTQKTRISDDITAGKHTKLSNEIVTFVTRQTLFRDYNS